MNHLIIDLSSIAKTALNEGKDQEFGREVVFNGKKEWVNGWQHGYERFVDYVTSIMKRFEIAPENVILVPEGKLSKARRVAIYPLYKANRPEESPEGKEQFVLLRNKLIEDFGNIGCQSVGQDGVEGDDVIAFLVAKLGGMRYILTNDRDMASLLGDGVTLIWKGTPLTDNPLGPFPLKYITAYKAIVGDTSDNIKGAAGFGDKKFLDFLVWAGDGGLAALDGMIRRKTLHELVDDVAEFKDLQKIIDSADAVYKCYEVALLHPEWIDTPNQPLRIKRGEVKGSDVVTHPALQPWATGAGETKADWWEALHPVRPKVARNRAVYDTEIIGDENPVFLCCARVIETGEKMVFWHHVEGDMARMKAAFAREDLTWISFNGIHFDQPLVSAAVDGASAKKLKTIASAIIHDELRVWDTIRRYDIDLTPYDHIDLFEVAPGVGISLKTYAGRLGYKTMVDLPFPHDQDLVPAQLPIVEAYCHNDLGVTEALLEALAEEVGLRVELGNEYGLDLRSKSDAQIAEAVLKKAADLPNGEKSVPVSVTYKAPKLIETDSSEINGLIRQLEATRFEIDQATGKPIAPGFLDIPVQINDGEYQCGVGGLHSTHDKRFYIAAHDELIVSDIDVAGYYPKIMLSVGLVPDLGGDAGPRFLKVFGGIYDRRIDAKRTGLKKIAGSLKIILNATFGKGGNRYSAFYSPEFMLAVTLTGQLNLLCLIYAIESRPGIKVVSANTDGITVAYHPKYRDRILDIIQENARNTGFEYEETRYSKLAMKDVNNYIAISMPVDVAIVSPQGITYSKGKDIAKRKGLYAERGLMKNPTMQVCSNMAVDYLRDGIPPEVSIAKYTDPFDFTSIRAVKGGGRQPTESVEIDDWVLVVDNGNKDNLWMRQKWLDAGRSVDDQGGGGAVKRKSRPKPAIEYRGGEPFGRIARWYMTTESLPPLVYVESGNKVPKTEGAKLCMTLPDALPDDLDRQWYINETWRILKDLGVPLDREVAPAEEDDDLAEAA